MVMWGIVAFALESVPEEKEWFSLVRKKDGNERKGISFGPVFGISIVEYK
jgi:hypothetical protein